MNAISSSVNKGAFKAAPKAGTVRRPRRPSIRAATPQPTRAASATRDQSSQPAASQTQSSNEQVALEPAAERSRDLGAESQDQIRSDSATAAAKLPVVEKLHAHEPAREIRSLRSRDKSESLPAGQDLPLVSRGSNGLGSNVLHERETEQGSTVRQSYRITVPTRAEPSEELQILKRNLQSDTIAASTKVETRTPREIKEEETSAGRSRKRASTRRRAREPTPETAENEVIDRSQLRMADLCKDLRKGKKSSKYEQFKKIAAERRRQQRLMNAGILHDADSKEASTNGAQLDAATAEADQEAEEEEEEEQEEPGINLFLQDSGAPRTRVVDGQIVIDTSSLQVDRALRDAIDEGPVVYIDENPLEKMVNSRTHSKRINSARWDAESTGLFYSGLSQWGTDFDMISRMFPGRNRKQIKSKFTIEERRNPALVTAALINKAPVDLAEYSRISEVEYRTVHELESELADLKTQFELEREEAIKEAQQRKSEMQDDTVALGVEEEPKKKSRKRDMNDGLEVIGNNDELEAEERRAEAERAAQDSDFEDA